jgi:hypothetical protein
VHSFPGVESVTRASYGLSTIRILRTRGDDFIITSIGRKGDLAVDAQSMKEVVPSDGHRLNRSKGERDE